MAAVDWVFIAVLLASVALGAFRGLLYEVLSLVNYLVALGLAQWLAPSVAQRLQVTGGSDAARYTAGLVFVFVASVAVGALLSKLHQKIFQTARPKSSDRVFGSVVGLVIGAGFLLASTLAIDLSPLRADEAWQASTGAGISLAGLQHMKPFLSKEFGVHMLTEHSMPKVPATL